MRWWISAAICGALAAACQGGAAFVCEDDSDCVLSGVPGVCRSNGHCSYPDAACTSGWSYPVGVPGLGGTCVDDASGTGSDDAADTTPGSTSVSSTSGTSTTSTTAGGSASTTSSVTDSTSTTTGPLDCPDGYEENDAKDSAAEEPWGNECHAHIRAALEGPEDEDWYFASPSDCSASATSFNFEISADLDFCTQIECGGVLASFETACQGAGGDYVSEMCCFSTTSATLPATCGDNEETTLYTAVTDASITECVHYDLDITSTG